MTFDGPMIVILAGVACTAIAIASLLVQQIRGKVDLIDTVTEFDVDRGVRAASIRKLGEAVALLVSAWVVVYDTLDGDVDPWIYGTFVTIWCARYLFGRLVQARAGVIDAVANGVKKEPPE